VSHLSSDTYFVMLRYGVDFTGWRRWEALALIKDYVADRAARASYYPWEVSEAVQALCLRFQIQQRCRP
jgi:hypothetical protein